MINYILSEIYATLKSKSFYITNAILFIGVIAGAIFLHTLIEHKVGNIYRERDMIFLTMILNMAGIMIFINWLICAALYGKNIQTLSQSISIGVKRSAIFFGKTIAAILLVIISHLVLILEAITITRFVFGELAFSHVTEFFLTWVLMLPLFISGLFFVTMLWVNGVKEIYISGMMLTVYIFSKQIFSLLALLYRPFTKLVALTPPVLFNRLIEHFTYGKVRWIPATFSVGLLLTIVSILIGYHLFRKKDF